MIPDQDAPHISVLRDEAVQAIGPQPGDVVVDGTFGAGGYSRAFLGAGDCRVFGIDRDPTAVARGRALEAQAPGRFTMVEGCFGDMVGLLAAHGLAAVDGIALDLGVSSMQFDEADRGFSFREDGPLDMRMGGSSRTAADIVNETPEADLADLIYAYGEERASRRVARFIVEARSQAPITRTRVLADIVARAIGRHGAERDRIHPATKTFQALRIAVNDELGELDRGLVAAERLLAPGGRLAVVSFHSLEDRAVKRFLTQRAGVEGGPSRHAPVRAGGRAPSFELLFRGAAKPGDEEIRINPRARSARLRAARRTAAPAWGLEEGHA
ncbi:16S rRNA (cytosine(1402)-N(4))-methyltransferase RsmH [Oleomonas cavernae]|uniref:Ribosomal RNA small subunit methyltransferase H n=1 Tax=Oleomonas cavernae TaxID=2320859 RepID=A0A418W970_9PROT|nr:16S rRNA (cytosine(1402)-N(4))-methyltransferase RsmH [Oleomonas cavernae]RJF86549.1 16S rRNA (cytosine(1402)-N(4))-methyltransferase RsmH [Oleomonas cavernae]